MDVPIAKVQQVRDGHLLGLKDRPQALLEGQMGDDLLEGEEETEEEAEAEVIKEVEKPATTKSLRCG